jgi:CheY-like chemotaxis protein
MTDSAQKGNAAVDTGHRLRVLCADDDQHVGDMLRYALQRGGHHVELVDDGHSALQQIAEGKPFDVVVTDHDMPRLTGLGLVERLRELKFTGKIIVHCSALRPKETAAFHALAVDHIFQKPVRLDDLLSVVQRLGNPAS